MSIKSTFQKFIDAETSCERHQALKDLEKDVKVKFEKDVKQPIKSVISKIKKNGIHIDITFGEQKKAKNKNRQTAK